MKPVEKGNVRQTKPNQAHIFLDIAKNLIVKNLIIFNYVRPNLCPRMF